MHPPLCLTPDDGDVLREIYGATTRLDHQGFGGAIAGELARISVRHALALIGKPRPCVPGSQDPPRFLQEMIGRCQMDQYYPVGLEPNPVIRMNRPQFCFYLYWKPLDLDCSLNRPSSIPAPGSADRLAFSRPSVVGHPRTNLMIGSRCPERTVRSDLPAIS